jgi:hypothetical protein
VTPPASRKPGTEDRIAYGEKSVRALLLLTLVSFCSLCTAQEIVQKEIAQKQTLPKKAAAHTSRFGVGIKMSSLGAGVEFAMRMTNPSNLRIGFNSFIYGHLFDSHGLDYHGEFYLRSAQLNYDWFPFHGAFHLSPGVLLYNGNKLNANISVQGGHIFTIDSNSFRSDAGDPIRGNAGITFWKVAPAFLIGWGNLVPRKHQRFTIPFEFGVVFHGQPNVAFSLTGEACDSKGRYCSGISSDPTGKSYIADERAQINRDLSWFKFYPVVSGGFAFSF